MAPVGKRRLLPDACYDFFVVDGRDGERWGPFDTPHKASRESKRLRGGVDHWNRCVFKLIHEVNERKVLALLREAPGGTRS